MKQFLCQFLTSHRQHREKGTENRWSCRCGRYRYELPVQMAPSGPLEFVRL